MQVAWKNSIALAVAFVAVAAGVVVGQGVFTFSDDFNRDIWDNGQTNAFLPAWSTPTDNFIPGWGTSTANRFNVEVQVAGPNVTIMINGSPRVSFTDADLQPGSVGVLSWGEGQYNSSYALIGMECRSLSVDDEVGATILNYNWLAAAPWRYVRMYNAAGTRFSSTTGDLRWDPSNGCFRETSNAYNDATTTAGLRNTDFRGPAAAYTGVDGSGWTDYEARARFFCSDNDGLGLLLRVADDRTFYRVTFVSELLAATPQAWRAPGGVSVQRCRNGVWKELYREDPAPLLFAYTPNKYFDVSAKIQTVGAATKIDLTITPEGGSPVTIPTITDSGSEALITDIDSDGEFDSADGDVWSASDTNNNGRWDPAEGLTTDVDGDHVFDPADGDVFSTRDTNNNGQWDAGEALATDVDLDGVFDPADGDVFDALDTNRNGRWDAAEPLAIDVDGDHVLDPLDGDVFDATSDPNNNGFWDGAPIPAGTAGIHTWGVSGGGSTTLPQGALISAYGGNDPVFVRQLDTTPLSGNVFAPTDNWMNTYPGPGTQVAGNPPAYGIRLRDGILMENSNGRQADLVSGGTYGDGTYTPYYIVKDPAAFTTGDTYTLKATLHNVTDDDGLGLIFGYVDANNYFRVGWRSQVTGTYGFGQGTNVQKIVNGVITQLTAQVASRSNQAGLWVKKLATGALEQVASANLPDGSGQSGVEFMGPRLVVNDATWTGIGSPTDYTFEYVTEVHDDWGIGPVFRFQNEHNYYRLTFSGQDFTPTGPPIGLSIQKVAAGVITELWKDTDPTKSGNNNVDPTAGFIYDGLESPAGFRTWRTRVTVSGTVPTTIAIAIDGIQDDGGEQPNYYTATVTDTTSPLLAGRVGFHTWAQTANELRQIKVWTTDPNNPLLQDGTGTADAKGWVDASMGPPTNYDDPGKVAGETGGTDGVAAGAPISGIGIRPDLNALGVRDNRYVTGVTDSVLETPGNNGRIDFDGPRAVVGKSSWLDYTYTVDLRQFDDDGIGIIFRYQDEGNFYRLMFMSQGDNTLGPPPQGVSVQKRRDGGYSELFYSNTFIYTPAQRWRVRVTATGAHFDIWIKELDGPRADTEYNYSFDDPSDPLLKGKVGVTVWGANGQANEGNTLLGTGLDWTQNFSEGGVFDNVTVTGTMGRMPPDLVPDGKINNADLILWQACFSGPTVPRTTSPDCELADVDLDGDVDVADFGWLQRCFSGDLDLVPTCVD